MTSEELLYRTEDFTLEDIQRYYVETPSDRSIIEALKSRSSVVLQGSRGVGKSYLLKMTQAELMNTLGGHSQERILPVYVTFNSAGLLQSGNPDQFQHWMMARICNRIIRAARQSGILQEPSTVLAALGPGGDDNARMVRLESVEAAFEDSWRSVGRRVDDGLSIDSQDIQDAVEDLCRFAHLARIVLLVDEAAHVFIPQQQRDFFTLMRDLRSPYISVKAAVYPGVTSYGQTFQPTHDSTLLSVDRDIFDAGYLSAMSEIVTRQSPSLRNAISRYGEAFAALSFAAGGNPRILLKTLSRTVPFNSSNASRVVREYFREDIWGEHTNLGDRYRGHRMLIDWGRDFVEKAAIPSLYRRNAETSGVALAIWIHRDAPAAVEESLRLLCYSGILQEAGRGLRATRSGTGTRYFVNPGCLAAMDGEPISYCTMLRQSASIKRFIEFGANSTMYQGLSDFDLASIDSAQRQGLDAQLGQSIDILDLSAFQKSKLRDLGFSTVGEVLGAKETEFRTAKWIGVVRSRQMMNAAAAAVYEYLSG